MEHLDLLLDDGSVVVVEVVVIMMILKEMVVLVAVLMAELLILQTGLQLGQILLMDWMELLPLVVAVAVLAVSKGYGLTLVERVVMDLF